MHPRLVLAAVLAATAYAQSCVNYGSDNAGSCACPAGFTSSNSNNCDLPNCGGSLYTPNGAAGSGGGNVSSCSCANEWTGPACTGEWAAAWLGLAWLGARRCLVPEPN